MKSNKFLTLILMLFCLKAFSQETENTNKLRFTGGYLKFSAGKGSNNNFRPLGLDNISNPNGKGYHFEVNPTYGVKVSNKAVLGISCFFQLFKKVESETSYYEKYKMASYGFSIFTRHTIKTFGNVSFLLSPNFEYVFSKDEYLYGFDPTQPEETARFKGKSINVYISPMLNYKLNSQFRLVTRMGAIGYNYNQVQEKYVTINDWRDPKNYSNFFTNFSLQNFSFGVEYLF